MLRGTKHEADSDIGQSSSLPDGATQGTVLILHASQRLVRIWPAIVLALLILAPANAALSHTISMPGISFSDELGGFDLERVTGKGSIADPFVVVERVSNPDGATLVFRADPSLGNLIGS